MGVVLLALDSGTIRDRSPHSQLIRQAALLAAGLAADQVPSAVAPMGRGMTPGGAADRSGGRTAAAVVGTAAAGRATPGPIVVPPADGSMREFWFMTGRGEAAPRGRDGALPSLGWYWRAPRESLLTSVVYDGPECLAVRDAFPKSAGHLLLLPRDPELRTVSSVGELRADHLPALSELHRCARRLASQATDEAMALLQQHGRPADLPPPAWLQWRMGYHNPPSLRPLHLHLITSDMQSPLLRSSRALEAFASPSRFITASRLEAELAGGLPLPRGAADKAVCSRCGAALEASLAQARRHLAHCLNWD